MTIEHYRVGMFIGTTDVYELQQLADVDVNSEEFRLLLVRLYQNLNNIVLALNLKDTGYYIKQPFVCGQQFFANDSSELNLERMVFRVVVEIGALPSGTITIAHDLTVQSTWTFTRIYGTATDNTDENYYPIPWVGAGGTFISLTVNNTDVVINNQSGVTFNECVVILEYITD